MRVPSLMASSKTSSQCKHDYVIAKMKREEIEKQNEAAIRLAEQKKANGIRLTGVKQQETDCRGNSARV